MSNVITVVNNIKFNKRQIISEIKSRRSVNYHQSEVVRNHNNRIIAQRFHFAGPQKDAIEIQNFFESEVIKKDDYSYYMEIETPCV